MKFLSRIGILLLLINVVISCKRQPGTDIKKHYSEEILQDFKKIYEEQKSRDTGIYLLDSLYNTFPYISAVDKYRYYDFKSVVFESTRHDNRGYDTAIAYIDSSIAVIEDNGLEKKMSIEYVKAFTIRGDYYTRIQRYSHAIQDITRSKQLNQEAGDTCLMAENTRTLSLIAHRQSDYLLAASLNKEATLLAASCKKDPQQFRRMQGFLNDLGYFYEGAKKYDSALFYYLAAEKYVLENKSLMEKDTLFTYEALENIYGNIGSIYYEQKKYAAAEFYTKKAIIIDKDILKDSVKVAMSEYILGTIYLSSGRINQADSMAQKALPMANKFAMGTRAALWLLKVNIAREKKQYKEEADYREKWGLTKDSVYNRRIELLKKNPFTEYEQLDKKYQVELLKKDNRNQQSKTNAVIAIGILVTLLAALSFYFIGRLRAVMKKRSILYKQLKKTMEEKEVAEKQLRENELFSQEMRLQIEFNEAIIQQRRQISDDMHDELSGSLAALKFYVEDIKNKALGTDAEKPLLDIREEVNIIYQNARQYMHSLKTGNWDNRYSLTGFLKEIQQKFSNKGLMKVNLTIDEENIKSALNTYQHDQLYHLFNEAITNIIKHAQASEINIHISFIDNNCNFSIADNGIGFNEKDQNAEGLGLSSIRNRIAGLNGFVNFISDKKGTEINGGFPVW